MEKEGQVLRAGPPPPAGSLSALWVPVSFPRRLGGAVSGPQLWLGWGQDSDGENRQTGRGNVSNRTKKGQESVCFPGRAALRRRRPPHDETGH